VNLTGFTIGAELWLAGYSVFQPLTVANGGIQRVSDANGQFTVIASHLLTARAPGDAGQAIFGDRTRVLIYSIDTYGRRQTLGVVPFQVFDGSEALAIDEVPQLTLVSESTTLQIVVAASQGAAGPMSISAAQISDGSDVGRAVLKAGDAAAARQALSVASIGRAAVNNADYLVKPTDTYVGVTNLTAPRTLTLPFADSYPPGQTLFIADESGQCSTDTPIIIAASGSDTIAGQINDTMQSPFQKVALHTNGTSMWIV
jgi:hypothetical protein